MTASDRLGGTKTVTSLALVFLFATLLIQSPQAVSESEKRYMLSHADGQGRAALRAVQQLRGKRARNLKYRNLVAADLTEKDLEKLRRHPLFRGRNIEEDPKRYLLANNSSETVPYGISQIQADQLAPGSMPVTLCIIDSGYDIDHGDLPGYERVTGISQTGDAWDNPGNSHGTHVAGTIAAIGGNNRGVIGVHPGDALSLHIVKVFNDSGNWTFSSDLIDALDSCVAAGATVVSMSLGGSGSSSFEGGAFEQAYGNGVLSIAAAGNGGNTSLSFPASYDAVVSVAAVDSAANLASFSQRNSQVELAGPGVGVDSTVVGGGYAFYSGTSMATPHVSGAAALLWSNNPGCTVQGIRRAMALSAVDLGAAGRDDSYGYGLVQVRSAHDLIANEGCDLPEPPPPPPPPVTALQNNQSVTGLSGGTGSEAYYSIDVPAGASDLSVAVSGGTGDVDLYLRLGSIPTLSAYDCRPYRAGNNENCSVANPEGTYYILLQGYSAYSGVTLDVGYTEPQQPPANQPPVASLVANPTSGRAPLVVNLDSSGSSDDGGIVDRIWDFGNGSGGSGGIVESGILYEQPGTYTASVTVSDAEGLSDTATVTITAEANTDPVASLTYSPQTGIDTDTTVQFSGASSYDDDGDALSYQWDFGDGSSATGSAASHVFPAAGDYLVQLSVNDGYGGTDSTSATISVAEVTEPPVSNVELTVTAAASRRSLSANLQWSGANGGRVRIYVDGQEIVRTRNDGSWIDRKAVAGAGYRVCEDDGVTCSPDVVL